MTGSAVVRTLFSPAFPEKFQQPLAVVGRFVKHAVAVVRAVEVQLTAQLFRDLARGVRRDDPVALYPDDEDGTADPVEYVIGVQPDDRARLDGKAPALRNGQPVVDAEDRAARSLTVMFRSSL